MVAMATVCFAAESGAELAKKTQNPIANLICLPLWSNWNFWLGPEENVGSYTYCRIIGDPVLSMR